MPDGESLLQIETVSSIGAVSAEDWDGCAGGSNPFLSHAFLYALEESRSVCREEGWLPQHLVLKDAAGALLGAAPLYLKGHSQGEYIFDYSWAHAYERAGGRYYPKLLSAIPFTPVTGPRILTRSGETAETDAALRGALINGLVEVARQLQVSSMHVNFPSEADARAFDEAGFLLRHGHQYHWSNGADPESGAEAAQAKFESFDDFLGVLSSRKRKNIRKERRKVSEAGLRLERLTGDALRSEHWDAFYAFYKETYDRKWGHPYLTRAFFEIAQATLRDKILLVLAYEGDRPVAGALNLIGETALYGRNWGSDGRYPFLHFEACYYQAIDFAIERGLATVEAGTQGEHKIQRGYRPVRTFSAHHIADPGFRSAVEQFLISERREVAHIMDYLDQHSPYRKEA
ncbi:MAG: GNAT family N-acetyltransferase [Alphaproteobacteria bacterium]|nr:GNAT family N-acetyltransferase [Alphaproteobacteria bacterium]